MNKEGLLVPCPFKAGGYCNEDCPNFFDVLVATAEEASNQDVSFTKVVEEIVNTKGSEASSFRMKIKHNEAAGMCLNSTKH